jgi:hypothetical protein
MRQWTKKTPMFHLACLLTLLASGDDFNFARLVWPFPLTPVPFSHLPLDDETTDFIESPKSNVSQCQEKHFAPPLLFRVDVTLLLPPYLSLPFESVSTSTDLLLCNFLFTPLLC